MKKIPYGLSDIKRIKSEGYYYIDKTSFIQTLEEQSSSFLMFLRPRRFGKSLLIAMLEAYYDKYYKKDFDTIFGDTFIYKNQTKEVSSYHVLRFDFSDVDVNNVEESFRHTLELVTNKFIHKYQLKVLVSDSPMETLKNIFNLFQEDETLKLYILIDEYDNFANKLLLLNRSNYQNIISEKTAMFKQFFTTLKAGATGNDAPIKRMFITGVTPMTMYDVTSGFNIGENISINPLFHNMVGVTEKELYTMLEYYKIELDSTTLLLLKDWYNHYIFAKDVSESIYNTDMIFYFLKYFIQFKKAPDELIDINVRSDYSKLRDIIYTNKKLNGNFQTLNTLIAGESIALDNLVQDFSALNISKEENFKSLLFYLGLVSIDKANIDIELKIPNETIKRIDIDFLKDSLELENIFTLKTDTLTKHLKNFALNGETEVFEFLADEIKRNTAIRDYIYNEQTIKSMFLAYLSLTSYFVVQSEAELNKGFADLILKPHNPYVEWFGLLEFKYIKRSDKINKKLITQQIAQAKEQLEVYEKDELVTQFLEKGKKLKKIVLVFHGWELVGFDKI